MTRDQQPNVQYGMTDDTWGRQHATVRVSAFFAEQHVNDAPVGLAQFCHARQVAALLEEVHTQLLAELPPCATTHVRFKLRNAM